MEKQLKDALISVMELLDARGIPSTLMHRTFRYSVYTDEYMYDAGFTVDRMLLDLFFDRETRVLFIGLLRLPRSLRRRGIGSQITERFKRLIESMHGCIFVDAAGDSDRFWEKAGFRLLFKDRYGFRIMGYAAGDIPLNAAWLSFQNSAVFRRELDIHETPAPALNDRRFPIETQIESDTGEE